MKPCLACGNPVEPFMSFGRMPIANGFLLPEQFADEHFFELAVAHCPKCSMVQLYNLVDERLMFHENYAFFSSTSNAMARHFQAFADWTRQRWLGPDPFVVEIGSNDGIMLRHFASAGIRHLGIEPSENVAAAARASGIDTISRFFNAELARDIVAAHGQADALLGANVMCHIPYLHSVAEGARLLLKPRGVLVFEDPYLGDIVRKTSYDQIYDEHAFYFSVSSVSSLFGRHGLEVIDALPQDVHGGSMRYVIGHPGAHPVSAGVDLIRRQELELGLNEPATFERLRGRIEASRDALMEVLVRCRGEGRRVVGYGATSKSTTVTNYCGIGPDLVEFISDTTPIKQGKFSPGTHIPVRPYEAFTARYPDFALLFAWNHAGEIRAKESAFRQAGGRWITYVPDVRVSD